MQLTFKLLDRRSVLDNIFFQNEVKKVFYNMILVFDVLDHIVRIYILQPLELGKYENSKLKVVRNTAPDPQRVLKFMRNPDWRIFSLNIYVF